MKYLFHVFANAQKENEAFQKFRDLKTTRFLNLIFKVQAFFKKLFKSILLIKHYP